METHRGHVRVSFEHYRELPPELRDQAGGALPAQKIADEFADLLFSGIDQR